MVCRTRRGGVCCPLRFRMLLHRFRCRHLVVVLVPFVMLAFGGCNREPASDVNPIVRATRDPGIEEIDEICRSTRRSLLRLKPPETLHRAAAFLRSYARIAEAQMARVEAVDVASDNEPAV